MPQAKPDDVSERAIAAMRDLSKSMDRLAGELAETRQEIADGKELLHGLTVHLAKAAKGAAFGTMLGKVFGAR